jgi:hypothetical protein
MLHSLLRSKGLTRNAPIPVSAGLLTKPRQLLRCLTQYRRGRPEPIVRLVAEATFLLDRQRWGLVPDLKSTRAAGASESKPGPTQPHGGSLTHARSPAQIGSRLPRRWLSLQLVAKARKCGPAGARHQSTLPGVALLTTRGPVALTARLARQDTCGQRLNCRGACS